MEPSPTPWTDMYLSGLRLGFTSDDLRTMPQTRLLMFVRSHNRMMNPEPSKRSDAPRVREATQADIRRMLM